MSKVNKIKDKKKWTLRTEILPGMTLFSLILLIIAGTIGVILSIISIVDIVQEGFGEDEAMVLGFIPQDVSNLISTIIMLIDIPLGLLVASLLSNRSKWAPFGMGGETVFYAFSILLSQNWALFIANGIYTPLIWIYGYFLWNREDVQKSSSESTITNEVKTKKLTLWSGVFIVGIVMLISIMFGALLPLALPQFFVGTKSFMMENPLGGHGYNAFIVDPTSDVPSWFAWFQIWLDAFLAAVAIVATTMAVFRYAETWMLFFISNLFKLILFGVTIAVTNTASAMMFVMAAAYFANAIYGMIVWKDSEEVDVFSKKEKQLVE